MESTWFILFAIGVMIIAAVMAMYVVRKDPPQERYLVSKPKC